MERKFNHIINTIINSSINDTGNYWDINHSPQLVFIIEISLYQKASPTGLVTIMA